MGKYRIVSMALIGRKAHYTNGQSAVLFLSYPNLKTELQRVNS